MTYREPDAIAGFHWVLPQCPAAKWHPELMTRCHVSGGNTSGSKKWDARSFILPSLFNSYFMRISILTHLRMSLPKLLKANIPNGIRTSSRGSRGTRYGSADGPARALNPWVNCRSDSGAEWDGYGAGRSAQTVCPRGLAAHRIQGSPYPCKRVEQFLPGHSRLRSGKGWMALAGQSGPISA